MAGAAERGGLEQHIKDRAAQEHAQQAVDKKHEEAIKAAHKGHGEVKAKPEPPVDFATLFYCASNETVTWPKAVIEWGAKSDANQYVLDQIRAHSKSSPAGPSTPLVQALIAEVLKAVKG